MKNWKKILAVATAGVICAVGAPWIGVSEFHPVTEITASAAEYTTGEYGDLMYADYGTYIEIMGYKGSATAVEIPGEINGVPVTKIEDSAFINCTSLTSITIPDGVTSIEAFAFRGCTSLISIKIPDSVTSIGEGAFGWCTSLISITLPDSVISIGWEAFERCESLTSITIPDNWTSIRVSMFYGCTSLNSITIPDSVTSIGYGAFQECESLTDVYYGGTKKDWSAIEIADGNESLTNAAIHFSGTSVTTTTTKTPTTTTTTTAAVKAQETGDLDGDGKITINDAYQTLMAYSKASAGLDSGLTDAQIAAADVDGDGKVTINDAYKILLYYATKSAGGTPSWD